MAAPRREPNAAAGAGRRRAAFAFIFATVLQGALSDRFGRRAMVLMSNFGDFSRKRSPMPSAPARRGICPGLPFLIATLLLALAAMPAWRVTRAAAGLKQAT